MYYIYNHFPHHGGIGIEIPIPDFRYGCSLGGSAIWSRYPDYHTPSYFL